MGGKGGWISLFWGLGLFFFFSLSYSVGGLFGKKECSVGQGKRREERGREERGWDGMELKMHYF